MYMSMPRWIWKEASKRDGTSPPARTKLPHFASRISSWSVERLEPETRPRLLRGRGCRVSVTKGPEKVVARDGVVVSRAAPPDLETHQLGVKGIFDIVHVALLGSLVPGTTRAEDPVSAVDAVDLPRRHAVHLDATVCPLELANRVRGVDVLVDGQPVGVALLRLLERHHASVALGTVGCGGHVVAKNSSIALWAMSRHRSRRNCSNAECFHSVGAIGMNCASSAALPFG